MKPISYTNPILLNTILNIFGMIYIIIWATERNESMFARVCQSVVNVDGQRSLLTKYIQMGDKIQIQNVR